MSEQDEIKTMNGKNITNLPPTLLLRIFALMDFVTLGRTAQVCRNWRDTAYHESLWQDCEFACKEWHPSIAKSLSQRGITRVNVKMDSGQWMFSETLCKFLAILHFMPELRSLHFHGKYEIRDTDMAMKAFNSPITELKIKRCLFSNALWENISKCCRNLVSLELGIGFMDGEWIPMDVAPVGLRQLVSLTITQGFHLTDACLQSISCNLLQLKNLTLSGCYKITDAGIRYLTGCHPGTDPTTTTAHPTLEHPILESLHLSGCTELTDISLKYLSRGQKSLKSLRINGRMSVVGLKYLSRLEDLVLQCGNTVCRGLHHLNQIPHETQLMAARRLAEYLVGVGSGDLRSVSVDLYLSADQGRSDLAQLPHLQHLKMKLFGMHTESDLDVLLKIAPQVTDLDISEMALQSYSLRHLCAMGDLRRLVLIKEQVDDKVLDLLVKRPPSRKVVVSIVKKKMS